MNFNKIDKFIKNNLETWKMSGVAVGVVKDGETIFKKGYGYRDIETKEKVETDSLFAIGSASKSFTSLGIAMLIKRGLIDSFDDKVKKYIPNFKTSCDYATEHMTIRDILSMRSGYTYKGYDNLLFYGSHFTMDEIIDRSGQIPFDLELRQFMRYDNLNFILAGKIIENVTGMSWHEFTQKEIIGKLNMSSSSTTYDFIEKSKSKTEPHMVVNGEIEKIKRRSIDNAGPAGSIVSSVDDMINWLNYNLSNNPQLVEDKDFALMHSAQSVVEMSLFERDALEDVYTPCYGLGWFVYEYNGVRCFSHGGSIDGYSAFNIFCPEHKLGIVVLTNMNQNYMHQVIVRKIIDLVTDREPISDYCTDFITRHQAKVDKTISKHKQLNDIVANATAIENKEKYCGDFESKMFGTQRIFVKDDVLRIERFDWKGHLICVGENEFVTVWDDPIWPMLTVSFAEEGKINVAAFGEFIKVS